MTHLKRSGRAFKTVAAPREAEQPALSRLALLRLAIMRYHVTRKQPNSKMCFICGMKNAFGVQAFFYELDNDELVAVFTPREEHQSYPGRMHGGIAAAILDETIGRAIMVRYDEAVWGVTLEFTSRYKQPIPLNQELRVRSRITKESGRVFEGSGEILLSDGSVAVEGFGKYLKMPIEKIMNGALDDDLEWRVVESADDKAAFEF